MSFFKFKSLVLFIKIVTKLLLLRPFGNLYNYYYFFSIEFPPASMKDMNVFEEIEIRELSTN